MVEEFLRPLICCVNLLSVLAPFLDVWKAFDCWESVMEVFFLILK